MKKFKNVIALLTLAAFIFTSTACRSNNTREEETASSATTESTVEETEVETEDNQNETTEATEDEDPYASLRNYDNEFYCTAPDGSSFIVVQPSIPQEGFRSIYITGSPSTFGITYVNDDTDIVVRVMTTYYPNDTLESWAAAKPDSFESGPVTNETVVYSGVEREVIVNVDSYSRFEFYALEADQGVYEIQVFLSNYVNRHDEYDRDMVDSFINAFMTDTVFEYMS